MMMSLFGPFEGNESSDLFVSYIETNAFIMTIEISNIIVKTFKAYMSKDQD